jgi:hypothetical protein
MNEDQDRMRMGHGSQNLAVLLHMILSTIQKKNRTSLRGKFKRAGWEDVI